MSGRGVVRECISERDIRRAGAELRNSESPKEVQMDERTRSRPGMHLQKGHP